MEYVTIRFKSGINMRPRQEGDVSGVVKVDRREGVLSIHPTKELASAVLEKFWADRGYKGSR